MSAISVTGVLSFALSRTVRWYVLACETSLNTYAEKLRKAAATGTVNMMPFILDCVRAYATLGEICDELRAVYGTYEEPTF